MRRAVARWRARLAEPHAPRRPIARVAINMRPARSSWGGGSEWARQMTRHLVGSGYAVTFELRGAIDAIVLADPRVGGLVTFGADEIAEYRRRRPTVFCLHRVNENDQRKQTDSMDKRLASANAVADHTVFISDWLRNYHAARWFDRDKPHSVILNGADPAVHHAIGSAEHEPGGVLRLVTHHWSDNWNKGFDVYEEIDRRLDAGDLPGTEFWVIGRWPREIRWRAARTFPAAHGPALADLLRRCHVYVTASRWEPGGMHFIEGAQCGLPVLYHEDGGGIVEVAHAFGVPFRDDVGSAIADVRRRYAELRHAVLDAPPSGVAMCLAYARLIQRGIVMARRVKA